MCQALDLSYQAQLHTSPLAKIDARIKLIISLAFALTIMALNSLTLLFFTLALGISLLVLARIKTSYLIKRFLPILPFILPIAFFLPILTPGQGIISLGVISWTKEGFQLSSVIMLRIITIFSVFTVLVATTERQSLLTAALKLGIPYIFIQIAQFAFRYIEVIFKEAKTMLIARQSRGFEPQQIFNMREIRELGSLLGMLFLRSYARAERIYLAMLARGYNIEQMKTSKVSFKKSDLAISTCFLVIFICLLLIDRGGINFWT